MAVYTEIIKSVHVTEVKISCENVTILRICQSFIDPDVDVEDHRYFLFTVSHYEPATENQ